MKHSFLTETNNMPQLQVSVSIGKHGYHNINKIQNNTFIFEIKYCLNCGRECTFTDEICECNKKEFLSKKTSNIIKKYIEISNLKNLRSYYNTKSKIKMNEKRMIQQLLLQKDKIFVEKSVIDKIYNMNVK